MDQPLQLKKHRYKMLEIMRTNRNGFRLKHQVCSDTGVSIPTMDRYLAYTIDDNRDIPVRVLRAFAQRLGCTMESLINVPAKTESNGN